jgi:hypothetical protein
MSANTKIHRSLEQLAGGATAESLNQFTRAVVPRLDNIILEMQRIHPDGAPGAGGSDADQDFKQACEFFACCVDPHDLSLNKAHPLAKPFSQIGCRDLHAIVAMGTGPTDACENIQAQWKASPRAIKHEVSPECLDIICRGGAHIVSMAKKEKKDKT